MALGRKTGGRVKGICKIDEAKQFVALVERTLKAGGMTDGLVNLTCRQLMNPDLTNPILLKLLEYKYGKTRETHDLNVKVEMNGNDADRLIAEYFSLAIGRSLEAGASDTGEAPQQDTKLLPS